VLPCDATVLFCYSTGGRGKATGVTGPASSGQKGLVRLVLSPVVDCPDLVVWWNIWVSLGLGFLIRWSRQLDIIVLGRAALAVARLVRVWLW
jgi:hypothetical protein